LPILLNLGGDRNLKGMRALTAICLAKSCGWKDKIGREGRWRGRGRRRGRKRVRERERRGQFKGGILRRVGQMGGGDFYQANKLFGLVNLASWPTLVGQSWPILLARCQVYWL